MTHEQAVMIWVEEQRERRASKRRGLAVILATCAPFWASVAWLLS